jgi:Protein of unknown function (DUF1207)
VRLNSRAVSASAENSRAVLALPSSVVAKPSAARPVEPAFFAYLSMLHPRGRDRVSLYALALLAAALPFAGDVSRAADDQALSATSEQPPEPTPDTTADEPWSPSEDYAAGSTDHIIRIDQQATGEPMDDGYDDGWTWQWAPTGLIYRSYMAGPHEPRAGGVAFSEGGENAFADATLGARIGFVKFGNCDPIHSAGWQLDFYGAAIARLDLKSKEDLDSCDYVFGLPLTYGNEQWQFKIGYAHISSHLGDEFMVKHPGVDRVNYVRDSLVTGTSYYLIPAWRVYGEVGWCFHPDGGAGPWESQFGTELSRPGPTGDDVTPFVAFNARVREDEEVVGDMNFQAGWLRRGILGQTLRFGIDYYNGKSPQSQFFETSEQQIGVGLWYDF